MTLSVDDLPGRRSSVAGACAQRRLSGRAQRFVVAGLALSWWAAGIASWGFAAPLAELAEPPLARVLDARMTLAWEGQGIGAALERLASIQRMPLWIDRRIDPSAAVTLAVSNATVREVLDQLAADESHDWGWTTLRTVVYFGPRQSARELATLSELARKSIAAAPADVRRRWLTPTPWEYPRLSEPRALVVEAAAAAGAQLGESPAPIPHDIWPARSLPSVAPVDRLTLLLAGFDLALAAKRDGAEVSAAPLVRPLQLSKNYPASEPLTAALAELSATDPDVSVRRQGRRVAVAGRWEDHEMLKRALSSDAPPAAGGGSGEEGPAAEGAAPDSGAPRFTSVTQRFTLRIANKPVGAVLAQLAGQLQLVIEWDAALAATTPPAAETLVSCDVHEADLDGLLAAILRPAGLGFTRAGRTVTVIAGP